MSRTPRIYYHLRAKIVEERGDYIWSSYHFYNLNKNPLERQIEIDRFA